MPKSIHMPTFSCRVRLPARSRTLRSVLLVLALLGAVLLPAAADWPKGYGEQTAAPSAQANGGESKQDVQDPGNLEPGTRVPVPPPFPPVEPERMEMNDWQRVSHVVDLDDGDLLKLPANTGMRHRHMVQLRYGFDLHLDLISNTGAFQYNVAVLKPAPKGGWEGFTPQKLAEELAQAELDTGVRAVDYSSLPVDFLFKTREGGIGLLRVKQSSQHPGSLVLLIKPVDQGPSPNAVSEGVATADAVIQSTTVEAGRAVFKGKIDAAHELVVRFERDGKPLEWRSSGRGDVFEVVVEASDKVPLGGGKTGDGFVVTTKVGTTAAGSGADVTNVHLAGDLAGAFTIRAKADLVTNVGAVTFADVSLEGGEKLPVTFRLVPKTK